MNKYFIRFEGSTGTLAVEKYLWTIIHDNYRDCIVSEDKIESIVERLKTGQEGYFASHRGNAVDIRQTRIYNGGTQYISVGNMCITLILIKGEVA